jgi:hypothetical protein
MSFSISGRIMVQTAEEATFNGRVFRDELEAAKHLLRLYMMKSNGRLEAGHRIKEAREATQALIHEATNEFFGD